MFVLIDAVFIFIPLKLYAFHIYIIYIIIISQVLQTQKSPGGRPFSHAPGIGQV